MLAKGYPATRVDEICAEAGVTKGSFYHHFASKEELADVLIDRYFASVAQAFTPERGAQVEPTARLLEFLDNAVKVTRGDLLKQGCLLGSFSLDLSETHPDMRAKLDSRFAALAKGVEPLIRQALKQRDPSLSVSAPALARQFVAVLQGGIVLAKAAGDHGRLTEAVRCYRETLKALLA